MRVLVAAGFPAIHTPLVEFGARSLDVVSM